MVNILVETMKIYFFLIPTSILQDIFEEKNKNCFQENSCLWAKFDATWKSCFSVEIQFCGIENPFHDFKIQVHHSRIQVLKLTMM